MFEAVPYFSMTDWTNAGVDLILYEATPLHLEVDLENTTPQSHSNIANKTESTKRCLCVATRRTGKARQGKADRCGLGCNARGSASGSEDVSGEHSITHI